VLDMYAAVGEAATGHVRVGGHVPGSQNLRLWGHMMGDPEVIPGPKRRSRKPGKMSRITRLGRRLLEQGCTV